MPLDVCVLWTLIVCCANSMKLQRYNVGVRYIFIGQLFEHRPSYRILGFLLFLQLGVGAAQTLLQRAAAGPATGQLLRKQLQQDQPRAAVVLHVRLPAVHSSVVLPVTALMVMPALQTALPRHPPVHDDAARCGSKDRAEAHVWSVCIKRVQQIDTAWWLQPEKDEELPSEPLGEVPASPQGEVPPQQRCPLCLSRCADKPIPPATGIGFHKNVPVHWSRSPQMGTSTLTT